MIIFAVLIGLICLFIGISFKVFTGSVSNKTDDVIFEVPEKSTWNSIASNLKNSNLIKNETFFKVYIKLMKPDTLKQNKYRLNESMDLDKIIVILSQDEKKDSKVKDYIVVDDEITITFQEGINMRKIASIIEKNTEHKAEDVLKLVSDKEYLSELKEKYWFITDSILDSKIYYPLEGYLFPDTYRFRNKDVTVKEVFKKLLDQMDTVLSKYKEDIEKNKHNVHEILTIASIVEEEVYDNDEYRANVVSVFENRLKRGMSLGSDVTTRYSLKIDNQQQVLKKSEYAAVNAYNTRSSTMAGKLPAGPISTVGESSIKAVLYHEDTDYIYFIANIKTKEVFFYNSARGFEAKKAELAKVNGGL